MSPEPGIRLQTKTCGLTTSSQGVDPADSDCRANLADVAMSGRILTIRSILKCNNVQQCIDIADLWYITKMV